MLAILVGKLGGCQRKKLDTNSQDFARMVNLKGKDQ
jgi:hypothetical protein